MSFTQKALALLFSIGLLLNTFPQSFAQSFTDTSGHKNEEAIGILKDLGVVNGNPDGSYRPDNGLNRAEAVKLMYEATGKPVTKTTVPCFPDVPLGLWFTDYVCSAFTQGLVNGYPNGMFDPGAQLKRSEALKLLGEFFEWNLDSASTEPLFDDAPQDAWYSPYLRYAKKHGITEEDTGAFQAGEIMTRGYISESTARTIVKGKLNTPTFQKESFSEYKKIFISNEEDSDDNQKEAARTTLKDEEEENTASKIPSTITIGETVGSQDQDNTTTTETKEKSPCSIALEEFQILASVLESSRSPDELVSLVHEYVTGQSIVTSETSAEDKQKTHGLQMDTLEGKFKKLFQDLENCYKCPETGGPYIMSWEGCNGTEKLLELRQLYERLIEKARDAFLWADRYPSFDIAEFKKLIGSMKECKLMCIPEATQENDTDPVIQVVEPAEEQSNNDEEEENTSGININDPVEEEETTDPEPETQTGGNTTDVNCASAAKTAIKTATFQTQEPIVTQNTSNKSITWSFAHACKGAEDITSLYKGSIINEVENVKNQCPTLELKDTSTTTTGNCQTTYTFSY